jgi:hypothetical protein
MENIIDIITFSACFDISETAVLDNFDYILTNG